MVARILFIFEKKYLRWIWSFDEFHGFKNKFKKNYKILNEREDNENKEINFEIWNEVEAFLIAENISESNIRHRSGKMI